MCVTNRPANRLRFFFTHVQEKKMDNKPKKPKTSYQLFCDEHRAQIMYIILIFLIFRDARRVMTHDLKHARAKGLTRQLSLGRSEQPATSMLDVFKVLGRKWQDMSAGHFKNSSMHSNVHAGACVRESLFNPFI